MTMTNNARLPIFLIFACLIVLANAFKVEDCSGKNSDAQLVSLEIDSCPDAAGDRCNLERGKNVTLDVEFEPTKTFSSATISIKGKIGLIYVPFSFPGPKEACNNYGFACPVKVREKNQMKLSLPVLRSYPSINLSIRFELTDEHKNPIVCFEFPAHVK